MSKSPVSALCAALLLVVACATARADTAVEAYRAQGIKPQDVLFGTVLTVRVLPGPDKQVVAVTTYFTGSQDRARAVNVKLSVLAREGQDLSSVYTRDFGQELGGPVSEGELQVVDLDSDGLNEIIVSFKDFADPLIERSVGEVIVADGTGLHTAWSGELAYDATRSARDVPRERRDRYVREIDVPATLRAKGTTLFLKKKVVAVAGERLLEPKVVTETFPLRQASSGANAR